MMTEPTSSPVSDSAHASEGRLRRRIGRWRFSTVELLGALVLLLFISPFVQTVPYGETIESGLMTLMLVAAVLAIGGRRRILLRASVVVAPAVISKWLHHLHPEWCPQWVYLVAALVFIGFVIVNLLRFVLRAPRVDLDVLCASICAYLLLGVLWALAYTLVAGLDPQAFAVHLAHGEVTGMSGFNAFYFSFVTLSTVGYGDITPISSPARMLAVLEAVTGPLYVAILIARLVALYSAPPVRGRRGHR